MLILYSKKFAMHIVEEYLFKIYEFFYYKK